MKNDYHFRQSIDIKLVDKWLAEIEDKAFSIFEYSMQRKWLENKKKKGKFFFISNRISQFICYKFNS
ncbi:unnamed protein product [Candidatus Protochlamydia amoebophila UWE25]|uniref:Uncharacterized protein n=1 Tax=Protochlamydia amoebophila (strain UWE25) TaxID=264201 RepID=Q6MDL2_PARUW|nr:unnamed protein product [Candidatus Protochlamydia amoebophila UWE25]